MTLCFLFRIALRSGLLPYYAYTDTDYTNRTYWFFDNYLGKSGSLLKCLVLYSGGLDFFTSVGLLYLYYSYKKRDLEPDESNSNSSCKEIP